MIVNVFGAGKQRQKDLEEAARFFACALMDPRMVRNLELDIEVERGLDIMGECINEDDMKNSRYFTIRLERNHTDDIIKTLAHEMVHVKQYAKNELGKQLRVSRGGGLKITTEWQGKVWNPKRKEDAYFDAPWEIEAYGREVGLYAKWIQYKKGVK
jgi:hypothetical protein